MATDPYAVALAQRLVPSQRSVVDPRAEIAKRLVNYQAAPVTTAGAGMAQALAAALSGAAGGYLSRQIREDQQNDSAEGLASLRQQSAAFRADEQANEDRQRQEANELIRQFFSGGGAPPAAETTLPGGPPVPGRGPIPPPGEPTNVGSAQISVPARPDGGYVGGASGARADNSTAAAQRQAILDNPNLSPEQRDAALEQVSLGRASAMTGQPVGTQYRAPEGVNGVYAGLPAPTPAPAQMGRPAPIPQPQQTPGAPPGVSAPAHIALYASASPNPNVRALAAPFGQMATQQYQSQQQREGWARDDRNRVDDRNYQAQRDRDSEPTVAVIDPATGQATLVRRSQAVGMQPAPSSPQVAINNSGETAEAKARGEALAKDAAEARNAASSAVATLDNVRAVRGIAADTDRFAPMREIVGGYLDALGVPAAASSAVRSARDIQAFNGIASNYVLGKQMEQRGVQTDGDRRVMQQTFASITNTNEANDFILRSVEAQANRTMERAEFLENWRTGRGNDGKPRNSYSGGAEAWNAYVRSTPLVFRSAPGQVTYLNEYLANADAQGVPREDALGLWRRMARP